jgi:hypothetical protein
MNMASSSCLRNTADAGGRTFPGNVFGTGKNVPDRDARHPPCDEACQSAYIHIFVPCPLGWGSASASDQDREACRRAVCSVVRSPPRVTTLQIPVAEYLKLRLCIFRRSPISVCVIQQMADHNIEKFDLLH